MAENVIERHAIASRAEWLSMRRNDLTASDLAAAVGADPHKSALSLWAEKTGAILPVSDNEQMRRGRWLEPAVICALREEHPDWRIQYPLNLYFRDPATRLGATPDAVADIPGKGPHNIQCKVVAKPVFERDWLRGPPAGYLLQTLCEGMLMEMPSMIAALVIDTYTASLHLFPVRRHSSAEDRVREEAARFWRMCARGERPRAASSRDAEILAAIYPQAEAEPVLDLTGNNRVTDLLLGERRALTDARKTLDERIAEIDTDIKDALGAAQRGSLPGWQLSWPTINRKEYTVKASTYRGGLTVTKTGEDNGQA